MYEIKCINCNETLTLKEIKEGTTVDCDCGCLQKCMYAEGDISKWRVMNPFSFKDKRSDNI